MSSSPSAPSSSSHDTDTGALLTPSSIRLSETAPRCDPSRYESDAALRNMTKTTRRLFGSRINTKSFNPMSNSVHVPLKWQNYFRDNGGFRCVADALVTVFAVPTLAVCHPSAVKCFVKISKNNFHKRLYYSTSSSSQFIDVFFPIISTNVEVTAKVKGMIFFVHGGAWGSGRTWHYRLMARPFLDLGLAVAIVGYRVYPLCGVPSSADNKQNNIDDNDNNKIFNGNVNNQQEQEEKVQRGGVMSQVDDLESALHQLVKEYPEWCIRNTNGMKEQQCFIRNGNGSTSDGNTTFPKSSSSEGAEQNLGVVVVGHSSGAHISLLWLTERAKRRMKTLTRKETRQQQNPKQHGGLQPDNIVNETIISAFIGISGVYNIDHHFDYEAGRGVEEISPLKPANGYNRNSFLRFTPQWQIQHELLRSLLKEEYDETKSEIETEAKENITSAISGYYHRNHNPRTRLSSHFPHRMLLVHGIEDDTVPFPSTGEAAKIMRQCLGGCRSFDSNSNDDEIIIDEYYIPRLGHQDTIVDLMLGGNGPVTSNILKWLLNSPMKRSSSTMTTKTSTTTVLSRL